MRVMSLDVAEHESIVAEYRLAHAVGNRGSEQRSIGHESMELTTLPAWIRRHREIGKELLVEKASGECTVELRGIDTDETSGETVSDEAPSQAAGVESPDWEKWLDSAACQQTFAIRSHVLEKKIAERDVSHFR